MQPPCIEQKLHEQTGQRVSVRWVKIEIIASDQNILRVGCLKNHHSTRMKYSNDFIEQAHQNFDLQMLDNMKTCNRTQTVVREPAQVLESIALNHLEALRTTAVQQHLVIIDP